MIKITPIQEENKFKPFSITLDIENETQAALIFAALLMQGREISIMNRKACLSLEHRSFDVSLIKEYQAYIENMMAVTKY
jgi:hypothetical protein